MKLFIIIMQSFTVTSTIASNGNTYSLGPVLGEGSFGKVHLAMINNEKFVAIKVIPTELVESLEISIMQSLKHENIVELYEVIETSEFVYLVLENVEGDDLLEEIINNGSMTEERAMNLFSELFNAISYCHEQNCAHRDLKLENVLLSNNGDIKVIDFGFAVNTLESGDMHSTVCGSGIYTAPEIVKGESYDAKKSDIWSMGVMLYAMVYGSFPSTENLSFPESNVSENCQNLIKSMLEENVAERSTLETIAAYLN